MLEIAGARLLAPYFGASIYVWTAMIGVILAALSLGYWYGGKIADKDNPKKDLSLILSVAAILVAAMTILHKPILELIASGNLDLRLSAVIAALVLFSIPSALIGMVSPHLAKIKVDSLDTSGAKIGRLEASSAIGSIVGTFAAGYFLLAYFGSRDLTVFIAIILLLTSFLADRRRFVLFRIIAILMIAALLLINTSSPMIILDKDTSYARYQVEQRLYQGKTTNLLKMDAGGIQSAYFVDEPKLPVLTYAKQIMDVLSDINELDNVLVIGGGAHTIPTYVHEQHPESTIQVVEIDPALDEIAVEYFGFKQNDKTNISYEDGRTFLNKNRVKYDVIIIDAYSFLTPPFQVSSLEAVQKIYDSLSADGLVMVNVASRSNHLMLSSLNETYREVFSNVFVHKTDPSYPENIDQNYILYASNSREYEEVTGNILGESYSVPSVGFILTDDFAPVERLNY
jgi:spermidine synthase